ncbi:hypothetical protein P8631_00900 [Guyparkeria sp. 1SP6A2]|nr:hypothetical protein [Guyparkeria sp. 1SP6A2]
MREYRVIGEVPDHGTLALGRVSIRFRFYPGDSHFIVDFYDDSAGDITVEDLIYSQDGERALEVGRQVFRAFQNLPLRQSGADSWCDATRDQFLDRQFGNAS